MEAIHSSETSVHTRYTRRHIPEDGILHSYRRENPKSSYRSSPGQVQPPTSREKGHKNFKETVTDAIKGVGLEVNRKLSIHYWLITRM
jgi:hypothetical protein